MVDHIWRGKVLTTIFAHVLMKMDMFTMLNLLRLIMAS